MATGSGFRLEIYDLGSRGSVLSVEETKALISCAVTMQLIYVFVFASAKSGFSHDIAQLTGTSFSVLRKSMFWEDDHKICQWQF